jgi:hypothetical protein
MKPEEKKALEKLKELLKPIVGKAPKDIKKIVAEAVERVLEDADPNYMEQVKIDVQQGVDKNTLIATITTPNNHPLVHNLMLRREILEARRKVDIIGACKQLLVNHAAGYKVTVPEVLPLVQAFYAHPDNGTGGCLHIVLDDGNVDHSSVQFCVDQAKKDGDRMGELLGRVIQKLSKTQRNRLYADGGKYL